MPPMKLKVIQVEDRERIILDETVLHHVMNYKIESSTMKGKAELSIKMLVEFPVTSKSD